MQVHSDINQVPRFRNGVITIGTFDGVHKGHQQLLSAMRREADAIGGETILVTFTPHPRRIVQPEAPLELINTLPEKTALLERHGLDHLVVAPFTPAFASLGAEAYIRDFLVGTFHPHTIIIGYDHHFGAGRTGNFALLERQAHVFKYRLIEIPRHVLNEISVSSTRIREALKSGDVETANELLGYSFSFEGVVVHGDKLGRQLGYPTANLQYTDADKIHLGEGVYAVRVRVGDSEFGGMLSIGKRPTLNDTIERVEVNLFDFDRDIYGESIEVTVVSYLRAQEKYATLDELKSQLRADRNDALRIIGQS
ncbi:MAG: riboflavin biosynthesis protein RibF [Flaviaesturariibacter sp.]|nr:riboflavin biosynthesis protein RibF [Flaviaesturariibacter sp.]